MKNVKRGIRKEKNDETIRTIKKTIDANRKSLFSDNNG